MGELNTTIEVDSKLCAAINTLENLQNTELADKQGFDALYSAIKNIHDVLFSLKTPSATLNSPINATKALTSISTALVSLRSSLQLDKTLSDHPSPPCSPLLQLILALLDFGLFSERWHQLMLSKDPTPNKQQYQAVQAALRSLARDATCPLISAVIQRTATNTNTNTGGHTSVANYMNIVHGLLDLAETSAALILFKRKTSIKSIRNYATVNVLWLGLLTILGSIPKEYFNTISLDSSIKGTLKLTMQSALNHFQETVSLVFQTRHAPDVKLLLFWLGQWTKLVSISPTVIASLDKYKAVAPIVAGMKEYVGNMSSNNSSNINSGISEVLKAIEDNAIWSKAAKVIILMLNGVDISTASPAADGLGTYHQHKPPVDWLSDVFSTLEDGGEGGGNSDKVERGSEHDHQDKYAAAMLLLGAHLLTQPASMNQKVKTWATQTLLPALLSTITQDAGGLASFVTMASMRTTLVNGIVAMYSNECGNHTRRISQSSSSSSSLVEAEAAGNVASWLFVASAHNPHPLMTSLFGAVWYELGMNMDERWAEQHILVVDRMFENAAGIQAYNSTTSGDVIDDDDGDDGEGSGRYEGHVSHLAWLLVCFLIGTTMSYNNNKEGARKKSDATDTMENATANDYFISSYEQFGRRHSNDDENGGDDVCTLAATSWRLKMAAMACKVKPSLNNSCSTFSIDVLATMTHNVASVPTPKECRDEDEGEVYWYWALDCTASALQHINMCDQIQQQNALGNKTIVENMKNLVSQAIKVVVGEVPKRGGGGGGVATAAAALSFLREVWTLDSTLFISAEQLEQLLPHLEMYTPSTTNRGGGGSKVAGVSALMMADMYAVFASPTPAASLFAYGFQKPPIDAAIPHLAFEHYKKYIQTCDRSCVTAVLPPHMLSTNNGVGAVQVDIALEVRKQIEQFVKRCPDDSFSNGGSENKDKNLVVVDNGRANSWVDILRQKSKYATIDKAAAAAAAAATTRREEKKKGMKGKEEIRVGWSNVMKAVVNFESIVAGSKDGRVTGEVATEIKALSCRLGSLV